jgi:hypothetical protein
VIEMMRLATPDDFAELLALGDTGTPLDVATRLNGKTVRSSTMLSWHEALIEIGKGIAENLAVECEETDVEYIKFLERLHRCR